MDKQAREGYIFNKKCLLILLFMYYMNGIRCDGITLISFGFHFDPSCNFKAIIHSKKDHIHKYVIHVFDHVDEDELSKLDEMGDINLIRTDCINDHLFPHPEAGLNIYFDDVDFIAYGFIEGCRTDFRTHFKATNDTDELLYHLNNLTGLQGNNCSASSFILWLLKLYTTAIHTDLIMGAGINEDYGAKNWGALLDAMNEQFYSSDTAKEAQIRSYVGTELFTSSMVLKTSGFDIYESLGHELYEFKEAKSFNDPDSTLYRCVNFIEKHKKTSVITYNYDTNLEYLLKKRNLLYCSVYDDSAFVSDDICDIYHVHGLLPYDRYDQKRFTDSLVFNETDYYYLYNNPYSWQIAKQLHDFKFNTCLFIGISLTDPDMKRLLELASNDLKFNFIFVKRKADYSEAVFKDITTYFFTFDLITIWINDYSEIGAWLSQL